MGPISYSGAKLFQDCPERFRAEKIGGLRSEATLPMKQGSFIHKVVEAFLTEAIALGVTLERTTRIGEDLWDAGGHEVPEVLRDESLYLASVVARRLVDLRKEPVVGIEIQAAINDALEPVPYDSPLAVLRGRIDKLEMERIEDDLVVDVWDLKGGRVVENPDESTQLAIYCGIARALMPSATKFLGKLYYPRYDSERVSVVSESRMDSAIKWALNIRAKVIELEQAKGAWPATPGRGCHDCPKFWDCDVRRSLSADKIAVPNTEEEAARMVLRAEVLSRELSETREMLMLFVKANGPIEVGGLTADIVAKHRYKWDVKRLLDLLDKFRLDKSRYLNGDTRKLNTAGGKIAGLRPELDKILTDRTTTELKIKRFGQEQTQEVESQ